ncbi:FAD-binding oxidoreductase [Lacisediminimonas sp.]|uniref:FAD-binding oxidoreductase n=1 Tax=Lacisediminimonas sp. TaxID=3060582 RepID=UPI002722F785|nr:FAD-binding oxidoreductase [Lacisediminimonas sp.]MDO8300678.1 FAD-binding oxidoreductase [Lacisediminimonas sp.]MDO9218690.1 FAD-binding oxidoreductase [Lacisediminimonas sp.]
MDLINQDPLAPASPGLQASVLAGFSAIVGPENVLTGTAHRYAYCRDRLPYGLFRLRSHALPATLPAAIVSPASAEEIMAIVAYARQHRIALIPFGAGSGVLGGTIPLVGEVMVDLKRLNRIVEINPIDGTVTVQAGMNGMQFEQELERNGYTAGHLPQSIAMSTVGGWVACRGAGQASSRYGKIEDMVIGLKAVLPNGKALEVRPVARRAVGPSIKDLLVGSEGVLGFITEVTLRIWRKPEHSSAVVLAFKNIEDGFNALREVVQSELRPEVIRLYDAIESGQRTESMPEFVARPILCIMKFSGLKDLANVERALALSICARHDAVVAGNGPYEHWESSRFHSYSTKWQSEGYYMDTIEITGTWTRLHDMYAAMSEAAHAVHPDMYFGAHWSHIYPEGACQYMTLRLPPLPHDEAIRLHRLAWDRIETICLEMGGSVAHHHGAGLFRNAWVRQELNTGMDLLQILKDGLDPDNLINPGKLGLRQPAGSTWES